MKSVLQRVNWAQVTVEGQLIARIENGLLVLLGVHKEDTEEAARWLARKVAHLRAFEDEERKMNRSVLEIGGAVLVIPNFTLYGDCRKGRRPGFDAAAPYEKGQQLYDYFCDQLAQQGVSVHKGVYGAHMRVALENNGPVTLILETSSLPDQP
ncbi:MAG: D-aminoacyl-tRNA deacylase [candidate division WOR-3 bacterium]